VQTLTPETTETGVDNFGRAVALGEYVIIGAPGDEGPGVTAGQGSFHIFE